MSTINEGALDDDDLVDRHVDEEIANCLSLDTPKSFFLFAGAGSGKTGSLVKALGHIQTTLSPRLRLKGQKVAVITYTNAACEEIQSRVRFDPLIEVRTIHSFCWTLIQGLNDDIRTWLNANLTEEIRELQAEERAGRKGTKASTARLSKIESKRRRLDNLPAIRSFTYSPTGDNRTRDALNHPEVLRIAAAFLTSKAAMREILVGRYPILLIDESQDTNKHLVDALFAVQTLTPTRFCLGLLGDMMQRIYNDGKEGLGTNLPEDWKTPTKILNYRCPKRVVKLINRIRNEPDKPQRALRRAEEGMVRLFIVPNALPGKGAIESRIAHHMAGLSGDGAWDDPDQVKTLILEHRMAAVRLGFGDAFEALYSVESWRTSMLSGTLPVQEFFAGQVLPLLQACRRQDRFAIARIAKKHSPLLTPMALRDAADPRGYLKNVSGSIERLLSLWDEDADPKLLDILRVVHDTQLFAVPATLQVHASGEMRNADAASAQDEEADPLSGRDLALEKFVAVPFSQIEPMARYFSGLARFDTHQGVKGREFERVMVIMDDSEARGFMFKYAEVFGGSSGTSKTQDLTRRLLYVTCSRARRSLALVVYTDNPTQTQSFVIGADWLSKEEIVPLSNVQ